jgi:hypothetical protein
VVGQPYNLVVAGSLSVGLPTQLTEWQVVRRKREWRRQLIELVKEGVAIRNEGIFSIKTKQAATAWIKKADDWRTRVFDEIERLDENAAEDYELLDIVPPPRLVITTTMLDHTHAPVGVHFRDKFLTELVAQPFGPTLDAISER